MVALLGISSCVLMGSECSGQSFEGGKKQYHEHACAFRQIGTKLDLRNLA